MLSIRSNERAAAAAGINVARIKVIAFGASAFIAGLAGALFVYLDGSFSSGRYDPSASITIAALVFIAGSGAISGAPVAGLSIAGGVIFTVLSRFGSVQLWQQTIAGIALIITAMLQPDGIAPTNIRMWRDLKQRLRKWKYLTFSSHQDEARVREDVGLVSPKSVES
jgi:branched-chain amino acid transport system permease protein